MQEIPTEKLVELICTVEQGSPYSEFSSEQRGFEKFSELLLRKLDQYQTIEVRKRLNAKR